MSRLASGWHHVAPLALLAAKSREGANTAVVVLLVVIPALGLALLGALWVFTSRDDGKKASFGDLLRPQAAQDRAVPNSALAVGMMSSTAVAAPRASDASFGDLGSRPSLDIPILRKHRPEEPAPIYKGVADYGVLCQELLVTHAHGIVLFLDGEVKSAPQEEALTLRSSEQDTDALAYGLISESSSEGGVMIESSTQQPIAFLRTAAAINPPAEAGAPRHVALVRFGRSMDPRGPPFAVVEADPAGHLVVLRGCTPTGVPGPALLHVYRTSSAVMNVISPSGTLVATVEEQRVQCGKRPVTRRVLRLANGTDAALIVCTVVAVSKLKRPA